MNRIKKVFPPGTFIPTTARVLAIVQLSLAFSLLLWHAFQPFMGDLFNYKSRILLIETVEGQGLLAQRAAAELGADHAEQLERNRKRFAALPDSTKKLLSDLHTSWEKKLQLPVWKQVCRAIKRVAMGTSLWEQTWISLSIAICLLLLLKIEGAVHACWLLPLVTLFYGIDVWQHPIAKNTAPDEALFPTEQQIFEEYLYEEPAFSPLEQQNQLTRGWHLYLVKEWAPAVEEGEGEGENLSFNQKVEDGEFAFQVARLELMALYPPSNDDERQPLSLIAIYILWNFFFAWKITKVMLRERYI